MYRYFFIQTFFLWTITWLPADNSRFRIEEVRDVCYPHIECFDRRPPWWKHAPLPQSPEKLQIKFHVMTRNTKYKSIKDWEVHLTETYRPLHERLRELDFRSSRSMTVFHMHGMYENNKQKWDRMKDLANAYLTAQDVNIIFVAWDAHTIKKGYNRNKSNCRIVGAVTAKFIENLIQYEGLNVSQIHIVGFSLGAHVAGYVGKRVPNIHRITALDAAQPGFENADPQIRLHHTDAQYVDVLHTNARSFFKAGVGYMHPLGHVDFYFNGGAHQPGCLMPSQNSGRSSPMGVISTIINGISRCSHIRSIEYWMEALKNRSCTMWGTRTTLPDFVVTQETYKVFGIPTPTLQSRQRSLFHLNQHVKHECTFGNCLPVGLNTFNLNSRGVFHVATGSSQQSFCIPRDESAAMLNERRRPCSLRGWKIF